MPGGRMEEQYPILPVPCRVCGSTEYKFAGYQWLPITIILKMGATPHLVDPERPDEAAVKLYTCVGCGNSLVEL